MIGEQWTGEVVELSAHVPEFAQEDWGKPRRTWVKITNAPTGIRTEHLLNMNVEPYRQTKPPGREAPIVWYTS
jgi:hypothetical protein